MSSLKQLESRIKKIEKRNLRVEEDKTWETSITRKIILAVLTYIVIVLFFITAHLPKPFVNAIVPTVGFILSTLSIPFFKKLWKKYLKR